MSDDSSQEEKQNFLRENILEKGYDTNMFVEFLINKKGEGGADVGNWSMSDLKIVVREFISMQSNDIHPSEEEQPIINNNSISTPVQNDPLSSIPQNPVYNDPLSAPIIKNKFDPLQSNPSIAKKDKYDPLSGGIQKSQDTQKKQKQTSSMSDFFSNNNTNQKQNENTNTNNLKPPTQSHIQSKEQTQMNPKIQTQIQPQNNPQMNQQMNPQMQNFF